MKLNRRQIIAYVAVAAVVVAVGVRYVVAPRVSGSTGGVPLVLSSIAPGGEASPALESGGVSAGGASSPAATPVADAVVYVCGEVRSPGVVRLPQGSRVADALALAGGATAKAELAAVNLAAKVADGQQILVPRKVAVAQSGGSAAGITAVEAGGAASASGAAAVASGAPVNINTASLAELDALQGVGPATAKRSSTTAPRTDPSPASRTSRT
jgi:competence protein ComEA